MNNQEFSNQFDTQVSSHMRFKDFDDKEALDSIEFDEYEKSLFLTRAQEELVLSLYNGRNSSLQSFEETEELRRHLSDLVEEAELSPLASTSGKPVGVDPKSRFFVLPDNLWFITYESVLLAEGKCESHTTIQVVPATQDEYHRLRKNPFRGSNDRRALRLDLSGNTVEIVCKYPVSEYYVRYIKRLRPIILENLPNGLTIEGISVETPCEVHEGLHQRILELAVGMALQSKGYTRQNSKENN